MESTVSAAEALARLEAGNQRFAANVRSIETFLSSARRADLVAAQHPFAIVLGCSDSRAPAEIVFDQGLGDLFVIRVAGNIVAPSLLGSVEFAAERFGVRLVVVMGHTYCGAVQATVEAITGPPRPRSENLLSIVNRVKPAIAGVVHARRDADPAVLMREAVRANVRAAAGHLRQGSSILERLILEQELRVVGAEYDLESGVVDFFDGVPL